jgi:hypothetical protein
MKDRHELSLRSRLPKLAFVLTDGLDDLVAQWSQLGFARIN